MSLAVPALFALGYHQLHAWNNPAVAWIVSHGVFMMMLPKFCALGITL